MSVNEALLVSVLRLHIRTLVRRLEEVSRLAEMVREEAARLLDEAAMEACRGGRHDELGERAMVFDALSLVVEKLDEARAIAESALGSGVDEHVAAAAMRMRAEEVAGRLRECYERLTEGSTAVIGEGRG